MMFVAAVGVLRNRIVINTAGVTAVLVFLTTRWGSRHLVSACIGVVIWGACGWARLVPIPHRLVGGFLLDDVVSVNHLGLPAAAITATGLLIGELDHRLIRRDARAVAVTAPVPARTSGTIPRAASASRVDRP
ncbi:hypothetical protein ACGFRG_22100 [Streptomyces sp. NPDC048696]|uniref:hypothetical protein n=1 Tax=Streptomyces sp. NPDC048696 TaxID=3365585 RepID=UPI0037233642